MAHYIGIDVGTGSARAALVREDGTLVHSATRETKTWKDELDSRIFEQSTENIWKAISECTRALLSETGVTKESVKGIGIDATCSLAVTDFEGNPICITKGKRCGEYGERNIILWADHRAENEANAINATGSVVLDYVGGSMNLEMEIPKILWLQHQMQSNFFKRCMFFDLPDYLTYRATGNLARSSCSLVCNCSYIPAGASPSSQGWNAQLFNEIGLGSIVQNDFKQLGGNLVHGEGLVMTAGLPIGTGLNKQAADDFGLLAGTPVGSAVIDAYAGWIGTIAASTLKDGCVEQAPPLESSKHRLAAVAGTSTCHMVQTPSPLFVPGVWGPYKVHTVHWSKFGRLTYKLSTLFPFPTQNALFPDWWMNEGGQSATGELIQFMITTHHAYPALKKQAEEAQKPIHVVLGETLETLREDAGMETLTELTKDMHFYPDLHGNRSPLADSRMRGSFVGLALDSSLSDLALKFNVTLEAIALQTRHIVDTLNAKGHSIQEICISGGQAKNAPLVQLLADICGIPIILPGLDGGTSVVLGAAMLGRFAAEVTTQLSDHASRAFKSIGSEDEVLHAGQTRQERAPVLRTQLDVDEESKGFGARLWKIMVEMTAVGRKVHPAASATTRRLLEAKYMVFLEAIEMQRRWRTVMEEASQNE